jgi:magnesium transporter
MIAQQYNLHPSSLQDCLQLTPTQTRGAGESYLHHHPHSESRMLQRKQHYTEVTNKVAIFYTDTFFITIHRYPTPFIKNIKEKR